MNTTIDAVFDGKVFLLEHPLTLAPNTRVRLTIELVESAGVLPKSFLQTARALKIDAPADFSSNVDAYLR